MPDMLSKNASLTENEIGDNKKGKLPKGKRNKPNTKLDIEALKKDVELYPRCLSERKS